MNKKYILLTLAALAVFLTSIIQINAQTTQEIRDKIGDGIIEISKDKINKNNLQKTRKLEMERLKQEKKKAILEIKDQTASDKANFKNKIKTERLEIKEKIKEKREEIIEKYKVQRAEFKVKIKRLADQKKAEIVERVDTKLTDINNRRTDKMQFTLDKLSSILDRLTEKVNTAKANGKNTDDTEVAIEQAKTGVIEAQKAISTQAAKEYVIKINTEDALKADIGSVVSQLEKDLRDTHKVLVDAKQAIQKVVSEFAKISSSVNISPTSTIY